jgi:hypothetical protein
LFSLVWSTTCCCGIARIERRRETCGYNPALCDTDGGPDFLADPGSEGQSHPSRPAAMGVYPLVYLAYALSAARLTESLPTPSWITPRVGSDRTYGPAHSPRVCGGRLCAGLGGRAAGAPLKGRSPSLRLLSAFHPKRTFPPPRQARLARNSAPGGA